MKRASWFVTLGLLCAADPALANFGFEATGSAQLGQFSSSNFSDNAIYLYDLEAGYSFKGNAFHVSFDVAGISANAVESGSTNAYAATLMGVKGGFQFSSWKWLGLAAAYYPSASLSESLTSATHAHTGSAYEFEAGAYLKMGGNWQAAFKLCYYSLNMTSVNTGSSSSSESYSRSFLFPSASLRWGF